MSAQRLAAAVLLLIAFLALAASRGFAFVDDIPGVAEVAIVLVGAASALAGVYLWLRKAPGSES